MTASQEKARKKRESERMTRKRAQEWQRRLVAIIVVGTAAAVLIAVGMFTVIGQPGEDSSVAGRVGTSKSANTPPASKGEAPSDRKAAANLVNPFEETDGFLAGGRTIFKKNCAGCHGERGEKPESHSLQVMSGHHSDGDYLWVVTYGQAQAGMPPHGSHLSLKERWQVVRFIRTAFLGPAEHLH